MCLRLRSRVFVCRQPERGRPFLGKAMQNPRPKGEATIHYTQSSPSLRNRQQGPLRRRHLGNFRASTTQPSSIAIAIAREIGDNRSEGTISAISATSTVAKASTTTIAIAHYIHSIAIAREIGDKRSEGIHLGNLGGVYESQGQSTKPSRTTPRPSPSPEKSATSALRASISAISAMRSPSSTDSTKPRQHFVRPSTSVTRPSPSPGGLPWLLALLVAQQGQMDEAQTLLEAGEPQVEPTQRACAVSL